MRHWSIECTKQAVTILGVSFEEFLSLTTSLLSKVGHQEIGHLPAMALFFSHDSSCCIAVVIGWSRCQEVALLFNRCKFSVTLDGDHTDQRITHTLLWNLKRAFPFWKSLVISEFDDITCTVPIKLNREVEIAHPVTVETNTVLPFSKVGNPVFPGIR